MNTSAGIVGKITSSSWIEVCIDLIEYQWEEMCYYDSPDDPYPRYCDPPILISETVIDTFCDMEEIYDPGDCSDPTNFGNGICDEGGGGDPNALQPPSVENNVTDPCINAAINKAINKNAANAIAKLINDVFNTNTNVNLFFSAFPFQNSPNTVAETSGGSANNPLNQQIAFNLNVTGGKSEEYLVATVFHEVLHAYLGVNFPVNSQGQFILPLDHSYMATQYVGMMKGALKSAYPEMSDLDAWGLAWGGLEETPYYLGLLTADQKSAVARINTEYSTIPGGKTTSKGSYCQ